MSKKFCKVDKKWCKFLKRGICNFCNTKLMFVNRCPRLKLIETTRLYELIKVVNFSSVFTCIYNWYEINVRIQNYIIMFFISVV